MRRGEGRGEGLQTISQSERKQANDTEKPCLVTFRNKASV